MPPDVRRVCLAGRMDIDRLDDERARTPDAGGSDVPPETGRRGRVRRVLRSPASAILLLAPFFGEALSGSTPPLDLVLPWNLALMAGLYGSGALICREVARRFRLGLLGLGLLGAAYGVYEEALVDRYWFYPQFWDEVGVGSYSRVWHTNVLLAVHLTAFHAAVSIGSSILIMERLFPAHRARAWAGRRGLGVAAVVLGVVVPFAYGEQARPGLLVLVVAGGLCVLLVGCAFLAPRPRRRPRRPRRGPRRGVGLVAFFGTAAHFILVYALPSTGVRWPAGVVISLAPIAAATLLIRRMTGGGPYGPDGLRVVTGILAFFVALDVVVGLGGRYDLIAGGLATALGLRWLHKRERIQRRWSIPAPDRSPT
jgi:hypothetical protein